ncbi:MAG TPA: 4-hydroxythreonine-4-phosphate dehydrogenase PdxA [Candidatus Kapabacteria bacterium]|nr:4-hydroxythreonine-4-phosphate dehydrogenase PdxA [Candidatus Kapabacteria bacterium]
MATKNKARIRIKINKRIAVTLGDPEGIGPEIVCKSLRGYTPNYPLVIIGSKEFYPDKTIPSISAVEEINGRDKGIFFYHINPGIDNTVNNSQPPGDISFAYVQTGIRWALQNKIAALVTAPISKEKWLKAGIPYRGHTALLAQTARVKEHAMFFWSDDLKVALFSIHIPLKNIFDRIKKNEIIHFIRFLAGELSRLFAKDFTFLVSGLNPHAGENGFLGNEENDEIIPAIAVLKSEITIDGPFPPDVIFLKAKEMKDSVVISWYHDQGLIAFKLLNIHKGVNLTLGLPYIRTSPDHGTAYDIAGKGIADPSSMKEAIRLAEFLLK